MPVVDFRNLQPLTEIADRAVITSDRRAITARLISDKRKVKTTKAICSPDDTYRFGTGSLLEMFRALETEEDRALAMNLIAEERIRQLEPTIPNVRDLVRDLTDLPKKHSPARGADELGDLLAEALSNAFGTKVIMIRQGPVHHGKSAFLRMVEDAVQMAAGEAAKQ